MDSELFIQRKTKKQSILPFFIKRTIDITLGGLFLIVSFPIFLSAALAIRIETKGSPFSCKKGLGKMAVDLKLLNYVECM